MAVPSFSPAHRQVRVSGAEGPPFSKLDADVLETIAAHLHHPWKLRVNKATKLVGMTACEKAIRAVSDESVRTKLLRNYAKRRVAVIDASISDICDVLVGASTVVESFHVTLRLTGTAKELHQMFRLAREASSMYFIDIVQCNSGVPDLKQCPNLVSIGDHVCQYLTVPPDLTNCTHLTTIGARAFYRLMAPPDLSNCANLTSIGEEAFSLLREPPNLSNCTKLTTIGARAFCFLREPPDLSNCVNLTTIGREAFFSLTRPLDLTNCTKLTRRRRIW